MWYVHCSQCTYQTSKGYMCTVVSAHISLWCWSTCDETKGPKSTVCGFIMKCNYLHPTTRAICRGVGRCLELGGGGSSYGINKRGRHSTQRHLYAHEEGPPEKIFEGVLEEPFSRVFEPFYCLHYLIINNTN